MHRACSLFGTELLLAVLTVIPVAARALAADPPPAEEARSRPDRESAGDDSGNQSSSALGMSRAVACRSIDGYEQYEPLDPPALTSDEKLLVYFRPRHYKVVRRDQDYVVHLSQDGMVRRKGGTAVLRIKKRLLDVESRTRTPPGLFYLRNTVSLKGLPPGDYEFDMILRDENTPGSTAKQTLGFRIVPAKEVGEPARPS
jgi:hypothetical protein